MNCWVTLNGYYHQAPLSFACILLTATCMTMYELTHSFQCTNIFCFSTYLATFLLAISPLTNKLQAYFKTRTFDSKITINLEWPEYQFLPELTITLTSYLPRALVVTIPDCFQSQYSCSEADKDEKPVYVRVSCFSFVRNVRQLSQPKLSIFECGADQRFDLHNNF